MAMVVSIVVHVHVKIPCLTALSFYINLPIGGLAALLILVAFRSPPQARPLRATLKELIMTFDLPGVSLILGSLTCLFLALERGGVTNSWASAKVIGCLIGFCLISIAFTVNEYFHQERALIVPRLIKQRTFAACALFIFR